MFNMLSEQLQAGLFKAVSDRISVLETRIKDLEGVVARLEELERIINRLDDDAYWCKEGLGHNHG